MTEETVPTPESVFAPKNLMRTEVAFGFLRIRVQAPKLPQFPAAKATMILRLPANTWPFIRRHHSSALASAVPTKRPSLSALPPTGSMKSGGFAANRTSLVPSTQHHTAPEVAVDATTVTPSI